jgi:DNA-directed RNA polymerase II subunit RPB1
MDLYVKRIKRIEFEPVNPEEIKQYSVCEITTFELYEKNGEPKFGGLNDTRMGTIDKYILCKTCKQNTEYCPGHFGHIELAVPVYNTLFMDKIKKILSITCHICSSLIIDKNNKKLMNILTRIKKENRIQYIIKANTNKTCYKCLRKQPKYSKDGMMIFQTFSLNDGEEKKQKIYASETYEILKNMSDEDIKIMGMSPESSRPEWCILTVLPIAPPCIRPSVVHNINLKSEDDLVYKLIDILKANQKLAIRLKNFHNKEDKYLNEYIEALQLHVITLIDNNVKGIPQYKQRSGRPLKTLKERIKGKEGRIRGNILGKRVDFSARTVVGPDPSINIDQLGVPYKICKIITFPETVNYYNYKKLEKLIINGPHEYPGANFIVKKTKNDKEIKLDLRYVKNDITIRYGDVVYRHLLEDDYVLFNRQPSLNSFICGDNSRH